MHSHNLVMETAGSVKRLGRAIATATLVSRPPWPSLLERTMDNRHMDHPVPICRGDELDSLGLQQFLARELPMIQGDTRLSQFPTGGTSLTYLIDAGRHQLVLRRARDESAEAAGRLLREYHALSHLIRIYHKIPRPFVVCEDAHVLGAPFYIMERMRGRILGRHDHEQLTPEIMGRLSFHFAELLAELHAVDSHTAALDYFGSPRDYIAREVLAWRRRLDRLSGDSLVNLCRAGAWLADNQPAESGACLIHNDFKYDNLVIDREDHGKIIGILDWEWATIGDPLMDLGTTLATWADPGEPEVLRFGPTWLPGNLCRTSLMERYVELSGHRLDNPVFYYVYGLFRTAVLHLEDERRRIAGQHRPPLVPSQDLATRAGEMAVAAIDKRRISDLL